MNWIDALIVAIIIVSVIKGYSEGFVLSLMGIVGLVTAIVAARLYFNSLAQYLTENTSLYEKIYLAVLKSLEGANPILRGGEYSGQALPEAYRNLFLFGGSVPVGGSSAAESIAQAISGIIISILSIILIFLVVKIAFMIVVALLNSLVELPVLRQFNKLGGIVIGFLKGVLGLMLAFALLIPVMAVFPVEWLSRGMEGSLIAVYFYRYNLIVPWFLELVSKLIQG